MNTTPSPPLAGLRFIVSARQTRKPRPGEDIEFPTETQDKRAKEWGESQGGEYVGTAADYKTGVVAPWDRKNTREWVNESGDKIREYDAIVATKTDRISRGKGRGFLSDRGMGCPQSQEAYYRLPRRWHLVSSATRLRFLAMDGHQTASAPRMGSHTRAEHEPNGRPSSTRETCRPPAVRLCR